MKAKTYIILIIRILGKFFALIYPYKIHQCIKYYFYILHSNWIAKEFGEAGKGLNIQAPIDIFNGKAFFIGENVYIGKCSVLFACKKYNNQEYNPQVIIKEGTRIGSYAHISAINKITIGKNVLIGRRVTIIDNAHGQSNKAIDLQSAPYLRELYTKGPITINDNVWIGEKATICPGVTIGKGSIIGANAVVTKSIPPYSIAAGCPAIIIKQLEINEN